MLKIEYRICIPYITFGFIFVGDKRQTCKEWVHLVQFTKTTVFYMMEIGNNTDYYAYLKRTQSFTEILTSGIKGSERYNIGEFRLQVKKIAVVSITNRIRKHVNCFMIEQGCLRKKNLSDAPFIKMT